MSNRREKTQDNRTILQKQNGPKIKEDQNTPSQTGKTTKEMLPSLLSGEPDDSII